MIREANPQLLTIPRFRGTWSRMIFYNLGKLATGDEVLLKDRAGRSYTYRVSA